MYPSILKKLIQTLAHLPGLGEKSATRICLFLISHPELCELLGDLIRELPFKLKLCKFCRNLSEEEVCFICKDDTRNKEVICVVENPVNVFNIESLKIYNGLYFVLHYLISPKEGIGPKELGLDYLFYLIKIKEIKELIIALSSTVNGEITASYILENLQNLPIKVTKIACGIPMGMELQFADPLTLKKALQRREILKGS
ncbi:MAG: recombination mediator RecR [Thermodesulfobacteriaceae bacterium]|nr:recombination mediator RecR [Thermodesulfobacteriaceae bacterium]MCX8041773.1 recombination mediator RecR [Thermodesulfobacteriaceae bacterium]MDW8136039.1 recombination mediator RecR [Thermodesulfobacterium sp.]